MNLFAVQRRMVSRVSEVKEDRSHCWFQIDPTSTVEDRKEAVESMALYLGKVHKGQL